MRGVSDTPLSIDTEPSKIAVRPQIQEATSNQQTSSTLCELCFVVERVFAVHRFHQSESEHHRIESPQVTVPLLVSLVYSVCEMGHTLGISRHAPMEIQ